MRCSNVINANSLLTSEVVFRQHILTTHVPGFECHECDTIIKPKDLVVGCSECDFFYHKKCTNLSKSQGGHWKPKTWKCHYCSSKTSLENEIHILEVSPEEDVVNLNKNTAEKPHSIIKYPL